MFRALVSGRVQKKEEKDYENRTQRTVSIYQYDEDATIKVKIPELKVFQALEEGKEVTLDCFINHYKMENGRSGISVRGDSMVEKIAAKMKAV